MIPSHVTPSSLLLIEALIPTPKAALEEGSERIAPPSAHTTHAAERHAIHVHTSACGESEAPAASTTTTGSGEEHPK